MSEDWYPWYPALFEGDTLHLTAAQEGIYRRLIDWYMQKRRPLPDNDQALAAIARIGIDQWLENSEVVREFFEPKKGLLHQKRCNSELDKQDKLTKTRGEVAKKGADARWSRANDLDASSIPKASSQHAGSMVSAMPKASKNHARSRRQALLPASPQHPSSTGSAMLRTPRQHATRQDRTRQDKTESSLRSDSLPPVAPPQGDAMPTAPNALPNPPPVPEPTDSAGHEPQTSLESSEAEIPDPYAEPDPDDPVTTKRGTRLAEDWVLTMALRTDAEEAREKHGLPWIDLDLEADKFANYWHGLSGQRATKRDWRRTWINWCLNATPPRGGPPPAGNGAAAKPPFSTVSMLKGLRDDIGPQPQGEQGARSYDPFDADPAHDHDVSAPQAGRDRGAGEAVPGGDHPERGR